MSNVSVSGLGFRIAACVLLSLSFQTANAASLSVLNGSFENPDVSTVPGFFSSAAGPYCYPPTCASVPGWTFAGLGGLFRPNERAFPTGVIDGAQVYFGDGLGSGSGVATQVLASTFQAGMSYALTVSIGTRLELPFGDGHIALFAGSNPSHIVAMLDLSGITPPPVGTFTDVSLTATALQVVDAAAVGQSIGILIGGTTLSGQSLIDNVRVAAVPEPGAYLMLLAGLGLLRLKVRRRPHGESV